MTRSQFAALCAEFTVDPSIALENDNIVRALHGTGQEGALRKVLREEF